MKVSKYISSIRISGDMWLFYGALNDAFVCVSTSSLKSNDKESVLDVSGRLRDDFIKAGILVDSNYDEISELGKIIKQVDEDDALLQLTVNPTINCNFKCWYCYEDHVTGSKMEENTRKAVVLYVQNYLRNHDTAKKFALSFFGGEPLLYFDNVVKPLVKECSVVCSALGVDMSVHFTTNGYLLTENIIGFLKNYNCSFQITLDGAKDCHDRVRFPKAGIGSYDKILSNIELSVANECLAIVRINYTTENICSLGRIIDDLKFLSDEEKKYLRVDFQRVWQDMSPEREGNIADLISEYLLQCVNNGINATSHYALDMVRSSCYGDKKNYLLVNFNGDLYKCTARNFAKTPAIGKLRLDGTAAWNEDIRKIRDNIKLTKEVCRECKIAPLCAGGCR
ncbi:MAG: radical SAM protein [Muribaculaceae bacterium]|nr:radical SAM protein [Muribaculaceae bacterium]